MSKEKIDPGAPYSVLGDKITKDGAIEEAAEKIGDPPDAPPETVEFPAWPKEEQRARRLWLMTAPYRVTYVMDGVLYRFTIPAQPDDPFPYDGASIHRIVWSIFAADKLHKESGPHDYAYRHGGRLPPGVWQYWDGSEWRDVDDNMSREHSDRLLLLMARCNDDGPTSAGARLAYRLLRIGGGGAWGPKDDPEVPEVPEAIIVKEG